MRSGSESLATGMESMGRPERHGVMLGTLFMASTKIQMSFEILHVVRNSHGDDSNLGISINPNCIIKNVWCVVLSDFF